MNDDDCTSEGVCGGGVPQSRGKSVLRDATSVSFHFVRALARRASSRAGTQLLQPTAEPGLLLGGELTSESALSLPACFAGCMRLDTRITLVSANALPKPHHVIFMRGN